MHFEKRIREKPLQLPMGSEIIDDERLLSMSAISSYTQ